MFTSSQNVFIVVSMLLHIQMNVQENLILFIITLLVMIMLLRCVDKITA